LCQKEQEEIQGRARREITMIVSEVPVGAVIGTLPFDGLMAEHKPMGDEKTREEMIRTAKELRAFYRNLSVSDVTSSRAIEVKPNDEVPHKKRNKAPRDS
jgi:hypothetical protein